MKLLNWLLQTIPDILLLDGLLQVIFLFHHVFDLEADQEDGLGVVMHLSLLLGCQCRDRFQVCKPVLGGLLEQHLPLGVQLRVQINQCLFVLVEGRLKVIEQPLLLLGDLFVGSIVFLILKAILFKNIVCEPLGNIIWIARLVFLELVLSLLDCSTIGLS